MAEKVYLLNYADGIPSDWSANKFRQVFSFRKGLSITKDNLVDEGVPVISYGQIHSKLNTGTGLNDSLIRFVPETYMKTSADCLARYGDLVFADTSEDYDGIGNCALIDTEAHIFAGYHTIIARPIGTHVDSKYFAYLFQTDLWRAQIRSGVMGIKVFSVTQKDLRETMIFLPPLSEQHAIAAYLDRKCGQIDEIIADLQRQIECLQNYKKSLISEVVTKGLDPDVQMKDSGIEWIGQIPEHWVVQKIKFVAQTSSGATPSRNMDNAYFEGADIRWVRTLDLNDGKVFDSSEKITKQALRESSCAIMPVGTVCVAMYGGTGTIGKCGILMKESTTNQAVCSIVCNNDKVCPEYMLYQMIFMRKHWMKYAMGGRKDPNISQDVVRNMNIAVAPIDEQQAIASYLDRKCTEIDAILDDKLRQVENMKAHRKSVIYEYVTGKKRVKEVLSCP